jgi:hypothetical protein
LTRKPARRLAAAIEATNYEHDFHAGNVAELRARRRAGASWTRQNELAMPQQGSVKFFNADRG